MYSVVYSTKPLTRSQCNGLCPCNTCEKRKFQCIYTDRVDAPSPSAETTPKRRKITDPFNGGGSQSTSADPVPPPALSSERSSHSEGRSISNSIPAFDPSLLTTSNGSGSHAQTGNEMKQPVSTDEEKAARSLQHFSTPRAEDQVRSMLMSQTTSQGGPEEEAVVYSQTRMLQDPTGRLRN